MKKGSLQSSLVMAAGNPNWWNISNSMRAPLEVQQPLISSSPFLCPNNNSNHFLHHDYLITPTSSSSNVCHDDLNHANSWSQLIMGGLEGHEEDNKKLENWERQVLLHHHPQHFEAVSNLTWCDPPILPLSSLSSPSPPKSYATSGSISTQIVDFSNKGGDGRHPPPDRSSERNSNFSGRAIKRARVQPSSSNQSTLKVRKEKLGDRITALHQLVSPFGKTDTASVLLEAIGYIRFLQTQIEALSLPYLDSTGSGNNRHQQSERNCIFPEDPGQVHGDEEAKQDLRSRGLCLVPVSSSTLQVGSSNGADYWAPSQLGR